MTEDGQTFFGFLMLIYCYKAYTLVQFCDMVTYFPAGVPEADCFPEVH